VTDAETLQHMAKANQAGSGLHGSLVARLGGGLPSHAHLELQGLAEVQPFYSPRRSAGYWITDKGLATLSPAILQSLSEVALSA
jgi:hypothetical protein